MSEAPSTPAAGAAADASASVGAPALYSTGQAQTDLWSNGILAALQPGVSACDEQIAEVFAAQNQLASQIDRLTQAMATFQSTSRSASLAPYTAKLAASRKRVKKLTSDVGKVQSRLDDIRALVRKKEGLSAVTAATPAQQQNKQAPSLLATLTASKDSSPARSRTASVGVPAASTASATAAAAATPSAAGAAAAPAADSSASAAAAAPAVAVPADASASSVDAAAPSASSDAATGAPADPNTSAAAPSTAASAPSASPAEESARAKVSTLLNWE